MARIFDDNSRSIGGAPLVHLKHIGAGTKVRILAKLEGRNPAYSVKDRIGASMIWDAEERGMLKPNSSYVFDTARDLTNNFLGALTAVLIAGVASKAFASRTHRV